MPQRPTGTITFLFSDIEGSSRKWEQQPEAMRAALAVHDRLLRHAFESQGGYVFKTVGDAFCVAFDTAQDAFTGALEGQRALHTADWGEIGDLKVRMALHTGAAEHRDGDYFGPTLNRVSRILSSAHGAQVLLSLPTQELVRDFLPTGVQLRHLGEHRLRDLARPEHLFQLVSSDLPSVFPALRSLESVPNNLPVQLTSFVGREREMLEVKRLLGSTHLLTLTGMGGTGKTRLSLQVAADLFERFEDGVWFVEFATIADPSLIVETVAGALELRQEAGGRCSPRSPVSCVANSFCSCSTIASISLRRARVLRRHFSVHARNCGFLRVAASRLASPAKPPGLCHRCRCRIIGEN